MHAVFGGNRMDRVDALQGIKTNLGFELGTVLTSFFGHGDRFPDFGLTIRPVQLSGSTSLKAYRREVLEGIALYGEMHRFIPVYAYWNGARIAEVPVMHYARQHGVSNYGLERVVKVVLDLGVVLFLHRYAQKPIYVFGLCGLFSWAVGTVATIAAVLYKILGEKSFIQTPLPLIAVAMFFTGTVCFLLGLLAELSIRTYHESQGKPTYLVAARDNVESPARRSTDRTGESRPPLGL